MTKPQVPTADQVGGAFSVNASNGVAIYRLLQHDNIMFANGRSSPVVDPTGCTSPVVVGGCACRVKCPDTQCGVRIGVLQLFTSAPTASTAARTCPSSSRCTRTSP